MLYFTLHSPQSTTLHSTLFTLHSMLHTLHSTLHTLHSTLFCIAQSTVHWYGNRGNMYKTVQTTRFTKVFYVTAFGFVGCILFGSNLRKIITFHLEITISARKIIISHLKNHQSPWESHHLPWENLHISPFSPGKSPIFLGQILRRSWARLSASPPCGGTAPSTGHTQFGGGVHMVSFAAKHGNFRVIDGEFCGMRWDCY